jgi:hypothetical protein
MQVQTDDIGGFGSKLRIRADAPTAPPLQANVVLAQNAPDLVIANIYQGGSGGG